MIKKYIDYLNPLHHLGDKNYPTFFPLIATSIVFGALDQLGRLVIKDPRQVSTYVLLLAIAFILYFSFRAGIRGGFITTLFIGMYFFYFVETRGFEGERYIAALEMIGVLIFLFFSSHG